MILYQTDDSGYFIHTIEADADPMNPDSFLIPRGCVSVEPPQLGANESAKWTNGKWVVLPDYRGFTYWLADRSKHTITEPGIKPPTFSFDKEPPKTLDELKLEKKNQINFSRDVARNMNVSALGTTWQADDKSQSLLNSAITLANMGLPLPTTWRDANNNDIPINSVDQLLEIASAIATQVQNVYSKSWDLKKKIDKANESELQNIVW